MEITKVRRLLNSRRLEWDTYLPRHPAYISLLESPQQRIATGWKAEDYSTENLYHLGDYTLTLSDSGLRSAFNRAPSSFWRLQGTGVITTRPPSIRQRPGELIAPGPTSHSTPADIGIERRALSTLSPRIWTTWMGRNLVESTEKPGGPGM